MGTLAVNRKGIIQGNAAGTYGDAHAATSGTATDNVTGNQQFAMQYFFSSGRGGATHRFTRTFLHFDTSGITAGVSGMKLQLTGVTNADANAIGIKHTAGTGEGGEADGSNIVNDDFNNIDRETIYTASTGWATSGVISMAFTAVGLAAVIAQDDFNIALLGVSDFAAEEEGPLAASGDISNGIAFNSTIQLSFTDAVTGYTHDVLGVASANIGKVIGVATANIGKVINVD